MGCIPVMCPYWLITFTLNWVMRELFPVEFTTVISLSTDTCSISGEWRPASVSSTCFCVIQSSSMLAVLGWNSFIQPWSPGYITFLSKRTCLMLGRGITANYMYLYPCSCKSVAPSPKKLWVDDLWATVPYMLQSCNLQHTKTWFGPICYVLLHLSSCFAKIYDWYWTMFLFFLQRSFRVCKRKWWCGPWNCQKVYCIYTVFWKIYWQFLIPYSKDTHWWCNISGIFTFSFINYM